MTIGVIALGTIPRKTEKRGLGDVNVRLQMAGLDIAPGQWIYVDETGVIVADKPLVTAG